MMDGPMEDHLELLQTMSTDWGNWMQSVNAQEIVVEVEGVGTRCRHEPCTQASRCSAPGSVGRE